MYTFLQFFEHSEDLACKQHIDVGWRPENKSQNKNEY